LSWVESSLAPQKLQMISPGSALPPQTGHSTTPEFACCVKAGAEMSGLLSASQKFSLSG
jgi:hypothetical protein